MSKFILVRSPRRISEDGRVEVNITIEKSSEFDTTGYSFLQINSACMFEEWVPTEELDLYKRVIKPIK